MRNFNNEFRDAFGLANRQSVVYVKIFNDLGNIYLTSNAEFVIPASELEPEDVVLGGVIIADKIGTERINPEEGFSELGNGSLTLNEGLFTEKLRELYNNKETIFNNRCEIYYGDLILDFEYFELFQTLYIEEIVPYQTSYMLKLVSVEVFTKTDVFKVVEAFVKDGWTDSDTLTEIKMETVKAIDFQMVEHDSQWEADPDETIGYFQFIGPDSNGLTTNEIISYTSKTDSGGTTTFGGIERGRFNTRLVLVTGEDDVPPEGETKKSVSQCTEFKYLSLATGKMIWALMTNELYGQPGARIPDHWGALINPSLIDLVSLEAMGPDLWEPADDTGFHFNILNLAPSTLKLFLGREVLRVGGLAFRTGVQGNLETIRYVQMIENSNYQMQLTNTDVIKASGFKRNSNDIRNVYQFDWEWDAYTDTPKRTQTISDTQSQQTNNVVSRTKTVQMKAVRNSNLSVHDVLKTVTTGIRSRLVSAPVRPTITTNLQNALGLQVMDTVSLYLLNWPDFTSTDDVNRTFEIQSSSLSLMKGTAQFNLYGATSKAESLQENLTSTFEGVNHDGWDELSDVLIKKDLNNPLDAFVINGSVLTLLQDCYLIAEEILPPEGDLFTVNKVFWNGVFFQDGFDLVLQRHTILHFDEWDITDSFVDGVGRGSVAGPGAQSELAPWDLTLGEFGVMGGNDTRCDRLVVNTTTATFSSSTLVVPNEGVWQAIPDLNIHLDEDKNLVGFYPLYGKSGSGGLGAVSRDNTSAYTFLKGGDGGNGGASFTLLSTNLVTNVNTVIDMSGVKGNAGEIGNWDNTNPQPESQFSGGSGSGGYAGAIDLFQLDATLPKLLNLGSTRCINRKNESAIPYCIPNTSPEYFHIGTFRGYGTKLYIIGNIQEANTGVRGGPYVVTGVPNGTSGTTVDENDFETTVDFFSDVDVTEALTRTSYLAIAPASVNLTGVDTTSAPEAPVGLVLREIINTPNAPLGEISTVTASAQPPANASNFKHIRYTYTINADLTSYALQYKTETLSSFETIADGRTIRVTATSIGNDNSFGGSVSETITVKDVYEDPAIEDSVAIPKVTGLQIKNRVALNNFRDFKSGSCEFKWNASSNSANVDFGTDNLLGADAGAYDPYFRGYLVRFYRENTDDVVREVSTLTEEFIYTLDMNKRDEMGRTFRCEVFARGDNNQLGDGVKITANNPLPNAPTGIVVTFTPENTIITYTPPVNDVDYVGVAVDGIVYTGSTISLPPLLVRDQTITLTSVDDFGEGESVDVIIENPEPDAPSLVNASASYNSFKINFVEPTNDFDFVGTQYRWRKVGVATYSSWFLAKDSMIHVLGLDLGTEHEVQLQSIDAVGTGGLVSVIVTTENLHISSLAPIIEPVIIDEAGGRLITNNSGYVSIMGLTDEIDNPSINPLAFSLYNSTDGIYPFWLDIAGNVAFGYGDNSITFNGTELTLGDNVTIGSNADRTITVGLAGDYLNLNDALSALSKVVPAYVNGGFTATIVMLSGFVITEKIRILGLNLGWVTITSVDEKVLFDLPNSSDVFMQLEDGAVSPLMRLHIERAPGGLGSGYRVNASTLEMFTNIFGGLPFTKCGITSNGVGIDATASTININDAVFNNCSTVINNGNGSNGSINAIFTDCGVGVRAQNGCQITILGSFVNVPEVIDATSGAIVICSGVDFGGGDIKSSYGATVDISTCDNGTANVLNGGTIIAYSTTGITFGSATNVFLGYGVIYN